MIATALGLCLTVLPATTPQEPSLLNGDQDRVLLTYPLRGLVGRLQAPAPLPLWSFLDLGRGYPEVLIDTGVFATQPRLLVDAPVDPTVAFQADSVVDLLAQMFGDQMNQTLFVDTLQDMLVVTGDPQVAGNAVASLRSVEATLARSIEIRAALYEWDDQPVPPPVVSPDRLANLIGDRAPLWSAKTHTRSDAAVGLGQEQWTHYVGDVNVEVAQDSRIGDPVVRVMFEGVRLVVDPHSLIGTDDLVLLCQYAFGQRRKPVALRYTGIQDLPSLDVPEVNMDSGLASARIPNGGAMIGSFHSADGAGSRMLLVVSATHDDPEPTRLEALRPLPVSALLAGSTRGFPQPAVGDRLLPRKLGETLDRILAPDELVDLVVDNVDPDAWGDTAHIDYSRGHLWLRGDQAVIDRVEALLTQLQNRWLRNAEVELVTALQPASPSQGPFAKTTGSEDAGTYLHRVVIPALVGRAHIVVHGVETMSVRDMDVEIAQEASISNPVVDPVFSGIYASVLPYEGARGAGSLADVELAWVAPLQPRATSNRAGGDLYLPSSGISRFAHDGLIESGQAIDLGSGPAVTVDDQTYRTRQSLRVTLR